MHTMNTPQLKKGSRAAPKTGQSAVYLARGKPTHNASQLKIRKKKGNVFSRYSAFGSNSRGPQLNRKPADAATRRPVRPQHSLSRPASGCPAEQNCPGCAGPRPRQANHHCTSTILPPAPGCLLSRRSP